MARAERLDAVVVGGGIGGLGCALALARRGRRVAVLEASGRTGGRGASERERGFVLNQGPHALFEPSRAMLASLGVEVRAPWVSPHGTFADDGERLHVLPAGVGSFFGTSLFDAQDRLCLAGLFPSLIAPRVSPTQTLGAWLDARSLTPRVRASVEMLVRIATYGAEPAHAAADVALAQLRAAVIGGVRYVDGGWSAIVEAIVDGARRTGRVELALRSRVTAMEPTPNGFAVRTDEQVFEAPDVILAGPPSLASALLGPLGVSVLPAGPALRLACLDLALEALPEGATKGCFGLGSPSYVSVHSATADLAPPGGAVVHAALYLGAGTPDPSADRRAMETALDRAIPGWRDRVVLERSAPAALASSARVDAPRGLAGRPPVQLAALSSPRRGVFLVGDWVGARGVLLDGVLASALEASRLILTRSDVAPSVQAS